MFFPTRTPEPAGPALLLLMFLLLALRCGGFTPPTVPGPTINSFTAAKSLISAGERTTLTADFANGLGMVDSGVGPVSDDLPVPVGPAQTTTYTLTASDASGAHAERAVTVRVVPVPAEPVILPPATVEPGQTGLTASVAEQPGCTFLWTLNAQGGVITAGAQGPVVTFNTASFGELVLSCTVTNAAGKAAPAARLKFPLGGPTVADFAAEEPVITQGDSTRLAFTFSGGAGVISAAGLPDIPVLITDVSCPVAPARTTTYTFSVTNSKGDQKAVSEVTVQVVPPPAVRLFSASPDLIGTGAGTRLFAEYDAGPGGSAAVDQLAGAVADHGSIETGTLEKSTAFTLTVKNAAGREATATAKVLVGSLEVLAGTPTGEGSGDGTGAKARFLGPSGVVQDSDGSFLVADTGNHTIRRIDSAWKVTTLAGKQGLAGTDDGAGAAARFNAPAGLALDPATGDLLVADSGNHAIRRVTRAGAVTTLAGTPGVKGHADGAALAAGFDKPTGLAAALVTGEPVLFVADTGNATIRRIRLAAGAVDTLCGVPGDAGGADGDAASARLGAPAGLAWRASSPPVLYVADALNNTIRAVSLDGTVRTVAGDPGGAAGTDDGQGEAARFDHPRGLALDPAKRILYVADTGNSALRAIALADGSVSLLAGTAGDAGSTDDPARFNLLEAVALDGDGNLLAADTGNATLRGVTSAGVVTTRAGAPGGEGHGPGPGAAFRMPRGAVLDSASGVLWVADQGNQLIRKVLPDGAVETLAGEPAVAGSADGAGTGGARFDQPAAVARDSQGNLVVADQGNHTIRRIAPDGTVSTLAGAPGVAGSADGAGANARFNLPSGVVVDAQDHIHVADKGNHAIRRIAPDGTVSTLSTAFSAPEGLAFGKDGTTLYVADPGDSTVRALANGQVTLLAGKANEPGCIDGDGSNARLDRPSAIAVDGEGRLFVACTGSSTVCLVTPKGAARTLIGNPQRSGNAPGPLPAGISQPHGIAVDPGNGNIFVTIDDAVLKVDFAQ